MPGWRMGLRCGTWGWRHRALATFLFSPWCAPSPVDDLCGYGPTRPQVHTFSEDGHEFAWAPRDWPLLLLSRFLPGLLPPRRRRCPERVGQLGPGTVNTGKCSGGCNPSEFHCDSLRPSACPPTTCMLSLRYFWSRHVYQQAPGLDPSDWPHSGVCICLLMAKCPPICFIHIQTWSPGPSLRGPGLGTMHYLPEIPSLSSTPIDCSF